MTTPPVAVPVRHHPLFEALNALDGNDFESMLEIVSAPPLMLNPDDLVERFGQSAALSSVVEVPDLVDALLSLSAAVQLHRWSIEDTARAVSEQVVSDGLAPLTGRVQALLGTRNLALTSKAVSLSHEAEREMHSLRVITDLRPVFDRDDESGSQPPVGMMVFTTLRIDFFSEEGSSALYLALTDDQVKWMSDELQWAARKAESLRELASRAELPLHQQDWS